MRYFIFILALLLAAPVFSVAQPLERDGAPFIGAQVFNEPGQSRLPDSPSCRAGTMYIAAAWRCARLRMR